MPPTRRIHPLPLTLTFILAATAVSCGMEKEPPPGTKSAETAAPKLGDAERKSAEARRAIRDYAYAEKAEFVAAVNEDLASIQAEMDRLSAKVDSSEGEAKVDAKAKLDGVRTKWEEAKERIDDAADAADADWDDVKRHVERSYGELEESFDDARQRLSDEIAPP